MVSLIILNYNTCDITKQCLESIKQYVNLKNNQVIVVDNGSSDGSIDIIKQFKWVKLIENGANVGFSKGNNAGIKQALGEYVLLLNSDTEFIDKQTLARLVAFAKAHPDAGAVVPQLLNSDKTIQSSVFKLPTVSRAIREYWLGQAGAFQKYTPRGDQPEVVEAAVMAAMLIPRPTLDKVGLLNEQYFMYFEDLDYCRAIIGAGLKTYYLPDAKVMHHHGASGKNVAQPADQWKRLIPSSKIYHGELMHYLINIVLWLGQKLKM
jgi:GT2 family glycosyltransferase